MASDQTRCISQRKNIAQCQISTILGDVEANKSKIIKAMKRAAEAGADIALFGELALTGYDIDNIHKVSETYNGPSAEDVASAAREFGIAVIYGYSEIDNNNNNECRYYDSLIFFDKHGKLLANYRKVHIWPTEGGPDGYKPGNEVTVVDWENLRIGLGICCDVCFPEFVQTMVLNGGAQLVVIGTALVGGSLYEKSPLVLVPARALENRCYIAYTDHAGENFLGMSRLCDPFAECLVSSKSKEEVMLLSSVPLSKSNDENIPFRYHPLRRPELYDQIISYETEHPWNRIKLKEIEEFFDNRADYYDRQMEISQYNAPTISSSTLSEICPNKTGIIIDVACGTGLVGQALYREGFKNLIGLDRNETMLKMASSKNVYTETILGGFEEEARKLLTGTFQAAVCVGAFLTAGWLEPSVTLNEMTRLVQTGGLVLLCWNATELDHPNCRPVRNALDASLKEIVGKGICEIVKQVKVPNYLEDCDGILCVLKKN